MHIDTSNGSNPETTQSQSITQGTTVDPLTPIDGASSSTATQSPLVDPYEGVDVHYRPSECKRCKKGELPPYPLLSRRLVIEDIVNKKFKPSQNHLCALRVLRILISLLKSNHPNWYAHDKDTRDRMFQQFKKFFLIPENMFKLWNQMAAQAYKNHMAWRRKMCIEHPEVAAKDPLWESTWSKLEFQEKSVQMKANRAKNPCGNRQHWLGRTGLDARVIEYQSRNNGQAPTVFKKYEIQFVKKLVKSVPNEDGELVDEETVVFANPHAEFAMAKSAQEIADLTQPDPTQPDQPATQLTELDQKKILAKHFGIGKRGSVIGLGAESVEVAPRTSGRKSRTATLELRHRELEEQLSTVVQEKESFKQQLEGQSQQLISQEAKMLAMQEKLDRLIAAMGASSSS